MESSVRDVDEAAIMQSSSGRKKGGWITFPFIIGMFFRLLVQSRIQDLSVFDTEENVSLF